jgi:excisionase family DNA binding protein
VSIPNFQQRERIMKPKERGHEILTIKEVSDLLQVHPVTLYRLIKEGKVPSFRIGKHWRFHRGRIVRWMAAGSKEVGH